MTPTPGNPQDDPLALERQVCFALAVASRTVISVSRPVLEPLNPEYPVDEFSMPGAPGVTPLAATGGLDPAQSCIVSPSG